MDGLDIGLLREMGIDHWGRRPKRADAFKSSRLARALKTTDETIRKRLKRLESIGVLRGYQLVPNFRHLGFEAACYYQRFATDRDADAAVERMSRFDETVGTFTFTGGQACVNIAYASPADQERKLRFLRETVGDGLLLKSFDLEMPVVTRPLSRLDWRIIQALRDEALRPLEEVGGALGVTGRTVKRRFERMANEGSIIIVPRLDLSRAEGMIPLTFNVHLGEESAASTPGKVLDALKERYVSSFVPSSTPLGHLSVALFAASVAEGERLRKKVESIDGVARADVLIVRGATGSFRWLDAAIARRLHEPPGDPARMV